MKKMLNFNITQPLFTRLKQLETLLGLSPTELIRRALEEYLEKKGV